MPSKRTRIQTTGERLTPRSPRSRIMAALLGDGRIGLISQTIPECRPGMVLVEVYASLVSPGTELAGWRGLKAQRENPQPGAVPQPFGYSNTGVVIELGSGVKSLKVGDRVACVGAGYAQHADYVVVPHNLCVLLPSSVTMAQGTYGMLAATGLHAVRRAEAEIGESTAIAGLGLVGQLTARLFQIAGHFVIGWDTVPLRCKIAKRWGIDATADPRKADLVAETRSFTGGLGLDAAVVAFGGDANAAMKNIEASMKISPDGHPMGRVVMVGNPQFQYTGSMTNIDIRRASRTGPGYHDPVWEKGVDYPPVFMRWTTRTNLALCLRLIAEGRLNVDVLTTHTVPLQDVEKRIAAMLGKPDDILGVVFEMRRERK